VINEKGDILGRLSSSYGGPERAVASDLKFSRHLLFHGLGIALGAVADRPHVSADLLIVFEKKVCSVLVRIDGDGALLIDLRSPIAILAEAHTETNKLWGLSQGPTQSGERRVLSIRASIAPEMAETPTAPFAYYLFDLL